MTVQRLICALTLIAFLPLAVGCSGSRTILVEDDPAESEASTKFQSGEPVEISGYTRPDDGRRNWAGFVRTVTPDSLAFDSKPVEGTPSVSFRLAQADVISFDARILSAGATTALAVAGLAVVGIVIGAVVAAGLSDMDFGFE